MSSAAYVNPLGRARVTAERQDQGVDYAGTGQIVSPGPGKIVAGSASGGWLGGGYVVEQLTAGPQAGQYIYWEEGVTPARGVGSSVSAGTPVANIIPGFHSGIEGGFAAQTNNPGADYIGNGYATYAVVHGGGYNEGDRTAAGVAFSNFLASLGAAPGLPEGRSVTGTYKPTHFSGIDSPGNNNPLGPVGTVVSAVAGTAGSAVGGAVTSAVDAVFGGFFAWIKQRLERGALTATLITLGAGLAVYGLIRALSPTGIPQATGKVVKTAGKAAMEAKSE